MCFELFHYRIVTHIHTAQCCNYQDWIVFPTFSIVVFVFPIVQYVYCSQNVRNEDNKRCRRRIFGWRRDRRHRGHIRSDVDDAQDHTQSHGMSDIDPSHPSVVSTSHSACHCHIARSPPAPDNLQSMTTTRWCLDLDGGLLSASVVVDRTPHSSANQPRWAVCHARKDTKDWRDDDDVGWLQKLHADESRSSKAFICVCLCVCVHLCVYVCVCPVSTQ